MWKLMAVLVIALGASGCSARHTNGGPDPAPGPIIQIGGGGGGSITFSVETPIGSQTMVAQTGSGSVSEGKLRDDFIGQRLSRFECKRRDNGTWVTANTVTIVNDAATPTRRLTIEKTSQDTIWWTFGFPTEKPPRSVALRPSGSLNTGTVPDEFLSLSAATMKETGLNQFCDEVRLRVEIK